MAAINVREVKMQIKRKQTKAKAAAAAAATTSTSTSTREENVGARDLLINWSEVEVHRIIIVVLVVVRLLLT